MRVLHVITALNRGGAEGALYRLCTAPSSNTVTVVSLMGEGVYGPRLRDAGVEVYALGMRSPLSVLRAFFRLRRIVKSRRPQVIQSWMYHADLIGGLVGASLRIPVCWGIRHSDLSKEGNKRSTLWVARVCAWISRWVPVRAVSCSVRAAEIHRLLGYQVRFEIVPNGLAVERWAQKAGARDFVRKSLGVLGDEFVFAHAGRSDPQKDHPTLAHAFSQLALDESNTRLLLCGFGLQPESNYFSDLPFTQEGRERVIALGPRDDLPDLWQAADSFVLSSYGEAFPNAVAEAMASGLPCVVTDVGDAAEIVGNTGIIVSARDPAALAQAMFTMKKMPAESRRKLGLAARRRIAEKFTLERMAEGFQGVWDEVVAEREAVCAD